MTLVTVKNPIDSRQNNQNTSGPNSDNYVKGGVKIQYLAFKTDKNKSPSITETVQGGQK